MPKEIFCAFGVDAVAGWLGSYGGPMEAREVEDADPVERSAPRAVERGSLRRAHRSSSASTASRDITSPYLASMSKRLARWGASARSPTADSGTMHRKPSCTASAAAARTQPLVEV